MINQLFINFAYKHAYTHYKTIKQSNSLHKIANVAQFGFFFTTNPSTFVSLRSSGIYDIVTSILDNFASQTRDAGLGPVVICKNAREVAEQAARRINTEWF